MSRKTFLRLLLTTLFYFFWILFIHQALFTNSRITYTLYYEAVDASVEPSDDITRLHASNDSAPSAASIADVSTVKTTAPSDVPPPANTMVVIHSYQRSGSSFFGDMFNHHPDVFYQYEPLDALFSSLYGTDFSWNVPADLFYYENGTRRIISDADINHVAKYLENLLSCNVDQLPTELLIHRFMAIMPEQFITASDFMTCSINLTKNAFCSKDTILKFCGKRYGMASSSRMQTCNQLLNNPYTTTTAEPVNMTVRQAFKDRDQCYHALRHMMDANCSDKLQHTCSNKTIRTTKLVRACMKSTGKLLKSQPNLYLIHLMRDPRGVAMSRVNLHEAVQGKFSINVKSNTSGILVREANMYCRLALDDIIERQELEKKYPGRILSVMYEDFVQDTPANIHKIYNFIKRPLNEQIFTQIYDKMSSQTRNRNIEVNTEPKGTTKRGILNLTINPFFKLRKLMDDNAAQRDQSSSSKQTRNTVAPSVNIATKWQKKIPKEVSEQILKECHEFYDKIGSNGKL